MVPLEFTSRRTRAAAVSQASSQPDRSSGSRRPQSRGENAVEVARTMLILMLVGFGIVALRYVLVFARSVLH